MNRPVPAAPNEAIVETMIELARCSKAHRIIVSGSKGLYHMLELNRRGYHRVVTAATCCLPRARYDVGLVDWRLQRIKTLETQLTWLAPLLAPASVLVVGLDAGSRADHRKLGSIVERLGFRIEAGTACPSGFAISARRRDANQQTVAA